MPAIEATGAYKVFGRRPERGVQRLERGETRDQLRQDGLTAAVINAGFEIAPGEIFVVMGLSGSGKSTLIRMVNGLLEPTAGSIVVDGDDITQLSAEGLRRLRRTKVSMVFQHFALLPHRTVGENAAYGLTVQGLNKSERQRRADEALGMVGLGGWGASMPAQLSGGMQQRVGLARALASGTDVMLMDEAFSALDPLIRKEMQDQLLELQSRLQKTILFITHDLNEAMRLGDRIAMMRDGRIEQIGTAEQILHEPANNYVAQFIEGVDRTKVLTAANVMEPAVAVVGAGAGPQAAHKLMREHQTSSLLVVGRDRTVQGVVHEDDVARAARHDEEALPLSDHAPAMVGLDTPIGELFAESAAQQVPLAVLDHEGRLAGVIPRVTLLSALSVPAHAEAPTAEPAPALAAAQPKTAQPTGASS